MSETMKRLMAIAVMLMLLTGFMTGSAWAAESSKVTAGSALVTGSAKVNVGDAASSTGEEVVLPVSIANNPGIAGLAFDFTVPEGASLKSIEVGDVLKTGTFSVNDAVVTWFTSDNVTANGVLMNVTLEAPSTPGSYEVKVSLSKGKASNFVDENSDNVAVEFTAGKLEVSESKPAKIDLSKCTISLQQDSYVYDGEAKTPGVTVMYGKKVLAEGTDYELAYKDNNSVGDASVTVSGKGYYGGEKTLYFKIVARQDDASTSENGSTARDIGALAVSLDTTGCDKYMFGTPLKPRVNINGLVEGRDYQVSYVDNINAGIGKVVIAGTGSYKGTVVKNFKIDSVDIDEIFPVLLNDSEVYTGSAIRPSVYFPWSDNVSKNDYQVIYSNNVNIGEARAVVVGKGNLRGTQILTFDIVPAKAAFKKVKSKKAKRLTIQPKAQAGGVKYQVSYRLAKKGKWKTKVAKKKGVTIKKLKAGKKYKVRVRAFKKVNGITFYGEWSKTKTVKIKR